ncbi:SDR family oxidoreductase [Kitasatospora sp. NPDC059811]|uniref:SDR family oxidoreductase n=1 Tax=Streptomycetaceae TaxID=2062 RepID=UPI0007AEF5AB|nr:SDR family oxidoreductase [Streptomyces sp. MJM8645]
MRDLGGKVALVTGTSRGIGRGIAERPARDGALAAVHYGSNEAAAKESATAIAGAGGRAFTVDAELGVPGDVDTLMAGPAAGLRAHGEAAIDILVHNAGFNLMGRPIEVLTPEEFDEMVAVNVKAPLFLTQRVLPRLRDSGRIINISSRNITVNSVVAGLTRTDMTADVLADPANLERNPALTALGRIGQVPDIADAVAFLASDDARWTTDTKIDVTGGVNL